MTENTISRAFVTQFEREIHLIYQKGAILNGTTREVHGVVGKADVFQNVGKVDAKVRIPGAPVVGSNIENSPVTVSLVDRYAAEYVAPEDLAKTNSDLMTAYRKALAMGVAKDVDYLQIEAMNTVSNEIPADASGFSLDKMLEASKFLDKNGVPNDGDRYLLISAEAKYSLLNDPKVVSRDYNIVHPLVENKIVKYSGFNIIPMESRYTKAGVNIGIPDNAGVETCFAWHKNSIGKLFGKNSKYPSVESENYTDLNVKIEHDTSRQAWQLYSQVSAGCGVIDESGVIKILADYS